MEETTKVYSDAQSQYHLSDFGRSEDSPRKVEDELPSSDEKTILIRKLPIQNPVALYADSPPSYTPGPSQSTTERMAALSAEMSPVDRSELVMEVLREWHSTSHGSFDTVPGGVSRATLNDWQLVKKEIGINCAVVENALSRSEVRDMDEATDRHSQRGNRFYNIYNTYIYGDTNISSSIPYILAGGVAAWIALQPFFPASYTSSDIPTYVDRLTDSTRVT